MRRFLLALLLIAGTAQAHDKSRSLLGLPRGEGRQARLDAQEQRRRAAPRKAYDKEAARDRLKCEKSGEGCVCPTDTPSAGSLHKSPACFEAFRGNVEPLSADLRERMKGRSWREGCPVPLDDLSLVTVTHWDLQGRVRDGRIIVSSRSADDVRRAFQALYEARFPIERMEPIDVFEGDDGASMAANNTTGFNCRFMKGSQQLSHHSEGEAIDLNPLQNPFVHGVDVDPPGGRRWLSRPDEPGVILPDGAAVRAFEAIGWMWGGRWKRSTDFQHFSLSGD